MGVLVVWGTSGALIWIMNKQALTFYSLKWASVFYNALYFFYGCFSYSYQFYVKCFLYVVLKNIFLLWCSKDILSHLKALHFFFYTEVFNLHTIDICVLCDYSFLNAYLMSQLHLLRSLTFPTDLLSYLCETWGICIYVVLFWGFLIFSLFYLYLCANITLLYL